MEDWKDKAKQRGISINDIWFQPANWLYNPYGCNGNKIEWRPIPDDAILGPASHRNGRMAIDSTRL